MAVARTPSPSDGRVPCPQCGGLVHPIAGRCKHCKADLAAQRASRPAAAAALPALRVDAPAPSPVPAPPAPAAPPAAPQPIYAWPPPAPAPAPVDEARPILPPRPTGRMDAAAPKRSVWRNWPVMVIVLASLAIAAAVVLMVWPKASAAKADSRQLAPPPAPERMDTNPLPPPSANGSVVPMPDPQQRANPYADPPPPPDDDTDADDDDLDPDDLANDPFSSKQFDPFGNGINPLLKNFNGAYQDQFVVSLFERVCARAKTCGNSQAAQMCEGLDVLLQGGTKPPTCASGKRCLAKIDQLACDSLTDDNLLAFLPLAQDCMQAIQDC